MMFLWGYAPDYWKALDKKGLLSGPTGLRFVNNPAVSSENDLFNARMASGATLHDMVQDRRLGLLVDRCCGGFPYHPYQFDTDLLASYDKMLENSFLGVQVHNWLSNSSRDWATVAKHGAKSISTAPDTKASTAFLMQGQPEDYSGAPPEDLKALLLRAENTLTRLATVCGGHINLLESSFLSYDAGLKLGAKQIMAGAGHGAPLTRVQLAAARGIARSHRTSWGVYLDAQAASGPLTGKEPAGKSRLSAVLYRRLMYHAIMSGASYLARESDQETMFTDIQSGELSSRGRATAEAHCFANRVKTGRVMTPVALLVDPKEPPMETKFLSGLADDVSGYALPAHQLKTRSLMQALFMDPTGKHSGNEWHCLTNGLFPDAFDIMCSDAPIFILRQYPVIVYLGSDGSAARKRIDPYTGKWIDFTDLESTAMTVYEQLQKHLPVWADGSVQWMVNELDNTFTITLLNNEGVNVNAEGECEVDGNAAREVTVEAGSSFSELQELHVDDSLGKILATDIRHSATKFTIAIPPGDIKIIRFRL